MRRNNAMNNRERNQSRRNEKFHEIDFFRKTVRSKNMKMNICFNQNTSEEQKKPPRQSVTRKRREKQKKKIIRDAGTGNSGETKERFELCSAPQEKWSKKR